MENETVDYGKVTGIGTLNRKFWGSRRAWGSALLSSFKGVKCGVNTATIQILGQWKPTSLVNGRWMMSQKKPSAIVDLGRKGGITVSGGEALLQIDFLIALFTKAKEQGSTVPWTPVPFLSVINHVTFEKFDKLMAVTDLVLLDIKEINEEQHKIVTSQTNKNILACASIYQILGNLSGFATCQFQELTDRDDDLIELGKFVKLLKTLISLKSYLTTLWENLNGVNLAFRIRLKALNLQQQIESRTLRN